MARIAELNRKSIAVSGTDPDELAALLSTPASPIMVQPLNGQIEYSCNFVETGPLSFSLCSYKGNLRCERQAESDKILIFLPSAGAMSIYSDGSEVISAQGRGTITDGRCHAGVHISGPRQHLTMIVRKQELVQRLSDMLERPIGHELDFHPEIDLTRGAGWMLKALAETGFAGLTGDEALSNSPLALRGLSETINGLLLEGFPHRFLAELMQPAPLAAPRHVDRAIDYMRAHLHQPITIEEIAAAANVGIRTLQLSFRQWRMTTPMTYLHQLRMTQAHQDLLAQPPGSSVAEIARKWGFSHLGRFAIDYKRQFGESPSETLRR